ncbi:MAG: LemA family protein [Candidatus Omnitrophota bacterium]|jgi:LemA protein
MILYVVLGIAIIIGFWLAGTYNFLVAAKNQMQNAWKQIDVVLKRRHDLIPNLIETVKGIMKFEQETFTKVIEARNKAVSFQGSVAQKAVQENALSGALRQLFALVENYPQLKSNENVSKLQEELSLTENQISSARQSYNNIATRFNIAVQSFPTNLLAGVFNFKTADLFEIVDEKEKAVPKVDLNLNK